MKNIFITGGTSHTGSRLIRKLLEKKYNLKCLLHSSGKKNILPCPEENIIYGSIDEPEKFANRLNDIEVIINVAHIRFAPQIINICKLKNIKRAVFLSSQRRFTKFPCISAEQVIKSEEIIEKSGIDYTIMRSAMIFGGSNDNNVTKMVKFIKTSPVFPLFNNGKNLIQPVFVYDLIDAIISSLENPAAIKKIYDIAGPEPISYKEFILTISKALNKKILLIPFSLAPAVFILKTIEKMIKILPITSEQVQRLAEDKTVDISLAKNELNYSPISFKDAIKLKIENKV